MSEKSRFVVGKLIRPSPLMATKVGKVKHVVHKKYEQSQVLMVPLDVREVFAPDHIVFIIDRIVDGLSMEELNSYYEGGGGSTYHPKMLIKVWIYGYCRRVYTSRPLAQALLENIAFMYLSGRQSPCFKTLSEFRGNRMQKMIDIIFKQVLLILVEEGYIDLGDLYTDGSKWEANGNRHKRVWKKNTQRYKTAVLERIESLLEEVKVLQAEEDERYGSGNLSELGQGKEVTLVLTSEQVEAQLVHLEELVKAESMRRQADRTKVKALARIGTKIEAEQEKLVKYEMQEQLLGQRNSYSQTDPDATMLRMKDERLLPAYNVQHTTTGQYIVNYTIEQNASDTPTLIPHLDKMEQRFEGLDLPQEVDLCADAAYGSEENYAELEARQLTPYVKYALWYLEQSGELAKKEFRRENWFFDSISDTYTCPDNRKLIFKEQKEVVTDNGYQKTMRVYQCESCEECPLAALCKKTEDQARTVQHSVRGEAYKEQAKQLLDTERGQEMRSNRSVEVETAFGDIKYNMKHDRFILRERPKVYVEYGLLAIGHNIRKMYCQQSGIWAAYYAQRAAKKQERGKKVG